MLRLICGFLLAAGLFTSLPAQVKTQDGWISLFDGKSTKGWHTFGNDGIGSAWKVEDGTLHLDASNKSEGRIIDGGDIVTDEEFENFHIKLEWKISEGGNSGIIFYVKEDTSYYAPWQTGPEMQVLDDERHSDAQYVKHRAGDLYDLISISEKVVKPAGEWNQAEIISDKGTLEFIINGKKVLHTTMWNENWNKLVAGSKFKDMPDFGKFRKGKIALQDHGDEVWYRNIEIKEL